MNDARGSVASKVKDVSALLLTVDNELVAKKDALADLFCNRSWAGHGYRVSSREVTRTAGYLYIILTYIFEGDHPLILSAYRGFEKLDAAAGLNSDGRHDFPVPTVEQIAEK